jgi:predicted small lipoprotein YifL
MKLHFTGESIRWVPLLACCTSLLSACGQYGDLYLPEEPSAGQTQTQQPGPPPNKDQAQEQEQQQESEQPQDL